MKQRITREIAKCLVGQGWHNLIDIAYNYIDKFDVEIMQVKEKFGSLRIYVAPYDVDSEFQHAFIVAIETVSGYICEVCGNAGSRRNIDGWYKTVCEDHEGWPNPYKVLE